MKTLDLRNLTPEARIAAINEAVAVMEGWTDVRNRRGNPYATIALRTTVPSYAGPSCDAVMPLLEKHSQRTYDEHGGEPEVFRLYSPANGEDVWTVEMVWMHHDGDIEEGAVKDKSLPIAACIALLRANGVEVLT